MVVIASLFKSCIFDSRIFYFNARFINLLLYDLLFLSCLRNPALPWPFSNVNQTAQNPPMTTSALSMNPVSFLAYFSDLAAHTTPLLIPGPLLFMPQPS